MLPTVTGTRVDQWMFQQNQNRFGIQICAEQARYVQQQLSA
jgi:hypothetical protein